MLDVNSMMYICKSLCCNSDITTDELLAVAFDMFNSSAIKSICLEEEYCDLFMANLAEFAKEKENHKNNNVVEIRGL